MNRLVIIFTTLLALSGCANLKSSAQLAVGADITTTVAGVASGLTEMNPLITSPATLAATGVARIVAIHFVDQKPEPDRTEALSAMSSMTWGIAASNAAIVASASNPVGAVVGIATFIAVWNSTEMARVHAAVCAVHVGAKACQSIK